MATCDWQECKSAGCQAPGNAKGSLFCYWILFSCAAPSELTAVTTQEQPKSLGGPIAEDQVVLNTLMDAAAQAQEWV